MKILVNKILPVLSLVLIPSMVFAQELETTIGLKLAMATLPIIIGVILVVCLMQFNED